MSTNHLSGIVRRYCGCADGTNKPAVGSPPTALDWRTNPGNGWQSNARAQLSGVPRHLFAFADIDVSADETTWNFELQNTNGTTSAITSCTIQDLTSLVSVDAQCAVNGVNTFTNFALPGSGARRLRIYDGYLNGNTGGTWWNRIISGNGTSRTLVRPPKVGPARRVVVRADSMWNHLPAASVHWAIGSVTGVLRATCPNTGFTIVGHGGDGIGGTNDNAPSGQQYLEAICAALDVVSGGPIDVVIQFAGYNNWVAGGLAACQTRIQQYMIDLRAGLPTARIILCTLPTYTSNATNGSGETMSQWRTMQAAAFAAVADVNALLVDGTVYALVGDISDAPHWAEGTPGATAVAGRLKTACGWT